jgi:outer membrane protein
VGAQLEAAEHGVGAARSDTLAARADLVLEVRFAYWGLVTSLEARRVRDEAIRSLEAHLTDARNREAFGMAARSEVLAVQVERDRAELESLRASAEAELAEARLVTLVGLPPSTRIEPTELLDTTRRESEDLEALVAEALASRPERAALQSRIEAAHAQVSVERSSRLPQVALSANYSYANPNRDIVPAETVWKDTWDAGVSVSLSVFDGGRRSAAVARAQARAESTKEILGELDRSLRIQVTQAALELRTSAARLRVAERGLESARENRRVTADRYREGVAASSELLDAEAALERAALARTDALAGLRLAAAGLDRAVGRK